MKKLKDTKLKVILPLIVCMCILVVGTTLAFKSNFTGSLTNKFTVGEVETEIDEKVEIKDIIYKNPSIENVGKNDCIVRARITVSPKAISEYMDKENSLIYYDETTKQISYLKNAKLNNQIMINGWKYEDDGFWYYHDVLKSKDKTSPIFNQVRGLTKPVYLDEGQTISHYEIVDELKGLISDFEITIYQEAVQATVYDENGNPFSVLDDNGNYSQDKATEIWDSYEGTPLN